MNPRSRLDLYAVHSATFQANHRVEVARLRLEEFDADGAKEQRLKEHWCKACFYILGHGLAGQAFTPWNCRACGRIKTWHNTAIPIICEDCARQLQLCRRCGSDMEQREGRRSLDLDAIHWLDPHDEKCDSRDLMIKGKPCNCAGREL